MGRIIEKKCLPEMFAAVFEGRKTFDLRLDDFVCQEGDTLLFREYDPNTKTYSGREVRKTISYVLHTKDLSFWDKKDVDEKGFVVMGIK